MKAPILFSAALLLLAACNNKPAPRVAGRTTAVVQKDAPTPADVPEQTLAATVPADNPAPTQPQEQKQLTPKEKAAAAACHAYLKSYIDAQLPLVLNSRTTKKLFDGSGDGPAVISYKYARFVPEMDPREENRFSREGPKPFYCLNKVAATADYTAVVYAFQNFAEYDDGPYTYTLITYSNATGKIIDKLYAGQRDMKSPYRVVKINPGLTIEAKDYTQKWAKEPAENGYYENKVVASALVREAKYHITTDGRIQRDDVMVGMR